MFGRDNSNAGSSSNLEAVRRLYVVLVKYVLCMFAGFISDGNWYWCNGCGRTNHILPAEEIDGRSN